MPLRRDALTESILLDYMRFQSAQQPAVLPVPPSINASPWPTAPCADDFPDAPRQIAPGFQVSYWRRAPMGLGRPRPAVSRLRVKEAQAQHRAAIGGRGGAILGQFPDLARPGHRRA